MLLLFTMVFLTGLPSLLNDCASTDLLPDWWNDLYPATYYFVGCYLREYGIPIKTKNLFFIFSFIYVLFGSFIFLRFRSMTSSIWWHYGSFFYVVIAAFLFELLYRIPCFRFPELLQKILAFVSSVCFGAYLISCIFDYFVYSALCQHIVSVDTFYFSAFGWVFVIFILSLLSSSLLLGIYRFLLYFVLKIQSKIVQD